jgi:transglutaminase-like putative cysteine protease
MLYNIALRMGNTYDTPASGARHIIRVMPMTIPNRQRLIAGTVTISPLPDDRLEFVDFFGQPSISISLPRAHELLEIRMQARVSVEPTSIGADLSPSRAQLAHELNATRSVAGDSPHHLIAASPRITPFEQLRRFALETINEGDSVLTIAHKLCERIYRDFEYDSEATTVDTSTEEAFELKRGVCQDFSHIMIGALRSLHIPAGYVSGFLRTIPPEGVERLEGADAMHAWVRIWCGEVMGYIELDPTNNIAVSSDHVVVGYGRDYADVSPVVGVIKSYGNQEAFQEVDVVPLKKQK